MGALNSLIIETSSGATMRILSSQDNPRSFCVYNGYIYYITYNHNSMGYDLCRYSLNWGYKELLVENLDEIVSFNVSPQINAVGDWLYLYREPTSMDVGKLYRARFEDWVFEELHETDLDKLQINPSQYIGDASEESEHETADSQDETNISDTETDNLVNKLTSCEWACAPIDAPAISFSFQPDGTYVKRVLSAPIQQQTGSYTVEGDQVILSGETDKWTWDDTWTESFVSGTWGTETARTYLNADNANVHCVHCGGYLLYNPDGQTASWTCENGHAFWSYPDSPLYSETDGKWYNPDGSEAADFS